MASTGRERVPVTVVYPLDPMGPKVGGSATFIRGFVQYAPTEMAIRFIGVTCDAEKRPPGRWSTQQLGGRRFELLPLLHEPGEDRRRLIPLSLRFVGAFASGVIGEDKSVLVHNRLETTLGRSVRKHHNIVIIHNDVPAQVGSGASEVLWSHFPWLYYRFERHVFRFVHQVYTVSSNTLEDYWRRYAAIPEKFAFVPTFVDDAIFSLSNEPKARLRAQLCARMPGMNARAAWVLFVGRLQPQKAPERVIDAFALLLKEYPGAQLIMLGEGNLRPAVEQRVRRHGLTECVHLLGATDQALLPAYYRAADVLLLASNFEGMPMCALEALACGLPVVSTRVGEIERVVVPGVTGEISREQSAECLVEALLCVLRRPTAYDPWRCLAAVQPYSPARVLAPIYARIIELATSPSGARTAAIA